MTTETADTNRACWLDGPDQPFDVREAPFSAPGDDEILIRTHAVAFNPVDAMRQKMGLFSSDRSFPWILGTDGAGTVHAVGKSITHLKQGDRVIAMSDEFLNHKSSFCTYQKYFHNAARSVCKIPENVSFEDGVVLPLTLSTAAGALFEKESMDLSWPRLNNSDAQNKQKAQHAKDLVVVFGGSSAVGLCAIQTLVLAGYHVIAASSQHNFELLKEAGAEAAFNYKDPTCADEMSKWAEERHFNCAGVLASVIDRSEAGKGFEQCAAVARRLPGRKIVGTTMARGMMELPNLGEGLKTTACLAIVQEDLLEYVWKDWLPKALESGDFKCLPHPEIVGHGLESVMKGCDIMSKGVSGKKLVVTNI